MPSPSRRGVASPVALTAAYYAALVLLGLATAIEGPSLPTLASHTASPLDRISLVFVADSLGYLLGSLGGGRLYDRLPGHRLMAVMLLLILVATIGFPLASVLWLLLALSFLIGVGKGAVDVGCNTLLQWLHGERVGPFMNGLHFFYGVGAFLAPLLLAQVILRTNEIHAAFWILAACMAPLAVWLWFLPDSKAHTAHDANGRVSAPWGPILIMVLAFVLYVGAELGFSNWIYTYAFSLSLADKISAAYLTSAYWALFTVGRLLGIWISTRLRSRTILYVDFLGCLASLALIGLANRSSMVLWAGSMGLGLFTASIFPTLIILAGERMRVTGTVTGLFLVGSGAGSMLLPWLIGKAFTSPGPETMIGILFVDMALGLAAVLLFVYGRFPARRSAPLPGTDR